MAELSLLAKATIVLAAALLAARAAGRAPASVRALVIASSFAVLLVLPLAIAAIPPRTVEIPAASMPALLFQEDVPQASQAPAAPRSTNVAPLPTSGFRMPSLAVTVRVTWAAGALLFVAPIVVALWRLRRMRTNGLPWLEGRTLVTAVARQAGVARSVDVFLHEALAAPMTCGLFRPAIGLPIDAPHWTEADLRHALVHEMEHVRRRDWPVHLLARTTCAFYWFHPLVWIAWRQLCLESERACDDAVVRGAEGTAYAEQLVSLARRLSKHSPMPMLSMADRSNLSTRVTAVLDSRLARRRAGLISALVIVSVAIGLTVTISPPQAVSGPAAEAGDQTPQAPAVMRFEVASVKRNTSGDPSRARLEPGGRFTAISVPVLQLITQAYGLGVPVVNAPDWVAAERYDVIAKAPEGVSFTPQTPMPAFLRGLLAERFAFQAHLEPREMPIYELVLARNDRTLGPKISRAAADCSVPRDPGPPQLPDRRARNARCSAASPPATDAPTGWPGSRCRTSPRCSAAPSSVRSWTGRDSRAPGPWTWNSRRTRRPIRRATARRSSPPCRNSLDSDCNRRAGRSTSSLSIAWRGQRPTMCRRRRPRNHPRRWRSMWRRCGATSRASRS